MPQEPAMQAINVDISMPIRRSFTTEEEYQEALLRWKRDSVNILTSQMHSSVTAGTWTPAMMNQLQQEIERINLATGSVATEASAPIEENTTKKGMCSC